jgi:hypothetical protein
VHAPWLAVLPAQPTHRQGWVFNKDAAGRHATRLDGSPLRYNQPDPYLPDFLMCRPEVAEVLLDAMWLAS